MDGPTKPQLTMRRFLSELQQFKLIDYHTMYGLIYEYPYIYWKWMHKNADTDNKN